MWWEKKTQSGKPRESKSLSASQGPPQSGASMTEPTPRVYDMPNGNPNQTVVGRSMVLRGDLSGKDDLLIEGQFDGTINLPEHCVTVGSNGEVKAEVHARQVVILGSLTGNTSARDKVEIRKTGRVVGDLVAAAIAIEDGAYFKGSIDIVRDQAQEGLPPLAAEGVLKAES